MQQATLQTMHTTVREPLIWSMVRPIQKKLLVKVFRQVVSNDDLHVFVMKLYHYGDSFGNATLRKFAELIHEPELKSLVERHYGDEERHASLFARRISELGGTPEFTPAELRLSAIQSYIAQLNLVRSDGLGLSEERLYSGRWLDIPEIVRVLVFVKGEEDQGALFFPAHLKALQALDKDPRTAQILEEIVPDEERHVAYISELLEKLRRSGFQPDIDEAIERCRRIRRSLRLPVGEIIGTMPAFLGDMLHFRPVGPTMTVGWSFLKGLSAVVRAVRTVS
jgi:bacterioferritin (cytochrome b1)